ncbi:TetR family transcriptional regulator [Aquimarina sp. MAR_2010_214]|uniref:TetR/AcrR family transcriptional regulator n=1 Tax=Aquimarina sp. MAR_2010_214 TaxID=1250026 RepID=UPI000C70428B|nr:TetR/AcrR family transcriptional regulator [Aquimarina sp. MAR_2010_214]PKV50431.1 TetR family transcriptional regulator [Aquimarina sp. MAR_2010_214]
MKTKEKIKHIARELFNKKGFKNVTLREVAKKLAISYGNVTYHFKTKNHLILNLYEDMLSETSEILKSFDYNNLFEGILDAPKLTFEISLKYLFFYVDFVEIKRNYANISLKVEQDNTDRKKGYLHILQKLQTQGIIRKELSDNDLDYLMDLSGAMRTFFFINLNPENFSDADLKDRYVVYVNNLIFPYLTLKGIEKYKSYLLCI